MVRAKPLPSDGGNVYPMPVTKGGFGLATGPKQCTAMSKRSRKQCRGPAVLGSITQKCRMHGGGTSMIGSRNPAFKTGRHSKFLPAKLTELYEEALANPDLIEMNDHIALLEARIQDVLTGIDEGEPVPRWSDVAEHWAVIETAILSDDADTRISGMQRMHDMLDAGMKWDKTWGEVGSTMEQLRKMVDTEVKRKKELNQMIPIERVTILVGAVGDAVKRNVTNPAEIEKVYREIAMLYGAPTVHRDTERVGPEVIDIPSGDNRGVKGGNSRPALRRAKKRKEMVGA